MWVQGAENDKVLIESVAPAWAALIQSNCSLCHSMAVKSPEDIYRYCCSFWQHMFSICLSLLRHRYQVS